MVLCTGGPLHGVEEGLILMHSRVAIFAEQV